MTTKTPEAWASDANARALRIELSAQRALLLPLDQLAYAEIETSVDHQQQVRALFTTHEVLIRGQCLRRLVNALQRLELSLVSISPPQARTAVPDGQPLIEEIVVAKVENPEAATPGKQAA